MRHVSDDGCSLSLERHVSDDGCAAVLRAMCLMKAVPLKTGAAGSIRRVRGNSCAREAGGSGTLHTVDRAEPCSNGFMSRSRPERFHMAVSLRSCVTVWMCGCATMQLCDCATVWLQGSRVTKALTALDLQTGCRGTAAGTSLVARIARTVVKVVKSTSIS